MNLASVLKYSGTGIIGVFLLVAMLLNLTGMTYIDSGNITCANDCYSEVQINSTYWNVQVQHAGTQPVLFKKSVASRTIWVNLDKVSEFVPTNPEVKTEILIPTTKAYSTVYTKEYGYLRTLKDNDYLIKRVSSTNPKGSRFIIHGTKSPSQTVKWGFNLDTELMKEINIDPVWFANSTTNLSIGLYLDSVEDSRYYEYQTIANIYGQITVNTTTVEGTSYTFQENASAWSNASLAVSPENMTDSNYSSYAEIDTSASGWKSTYYYENWTVPTNAVSANIFFTVETQLDTNNFLSYNNGSGWITFPSGQQTESNFSINVSIPISLTTLQTRVRLYDCASSCGYTTGSIKTKKYYEGSVNWTIYQGTSNQSDETVCIDLNAPGYGANYSCGVGETSFNYKVGYARQSQFNNTNISKNLTGSSIVYVNLTDSEVGTARFNFTGYNVTNSSDYPENIMIDILNNGSLDIVLPGKLNGTVLYNNRFTNGLITENILYPSAGIALRYLNYTVYSDYNLVNYLNISMNLSGAKGMDESINYNDYFWNGSMINHTASTVNHTWVWEDFSLGDITGRWSGDYTVYTGSKVEFSGGVTCGASESQSGTMTGKSLNMDFGRWNSMFVRISCSAGGGFNHYCEEHCVCAASGNAEVNVLDKTTNAEYNLGGGCNDAMWELRRDGTKIKFYKAGVYITQMDYDSTHQYEIKTNGGFSCSNSACGGFDPESSGGATVDLYQINMSGISGNDTGNFTWANSTVISKKIFNFSTNITGAVLTANEWKPDNTQIRYWMSSSDNASTAWEEVTNGVAHTFINQGKNLSWMAMLNTTGGIDSGDLETIPIIKDVNIIVSAGYPENVSIDLGYDGIADWNYTGQLNQTNSRIVNISGSEVMNYVNDNCLGDLTCKVPLSISTASGGVIKYEQIVANTNVLGINVIDGIRNWLTGCSGASCTVPFNITFFNGKLELSKLLFDYIGNSVYTAIAHHQNNMTINETWHLYTRYSPFNNTFPPKISSWRVTPYSLNQSNVTPIGQTINRCNQNNYSLGYCIQYNYCDIISGGVSCWNFDDNNSNDYLGSNNGNVTGAIWNRTGGKVWNKNGSVIGGAYEFNGLNDYISTPFSQSLNITGDITVAFWVKFLGTANNSDWDILLRKSSSYDLDYGATNVLPFFRVYVNGNSNNYTYCSKINGGNFVNNTWYFLTGIYDSAIGNVSCCINTNCTSAIKNSGLPFDGKNQSLLIGGSSTVSINGSIDQVQIWNRALSPAEISYLYVKTANRTILNQRSIPIFNITSLAKTDPIDLYVKLNVTSNFTSCANITMSQNVSKSDGLVLSSTAQRLLQNVSLSGNRGLWTWLDLRSCNRTNMAYIDVGFNFYSLCSGCVQTSNAFTD